MSTRAPDFLSSPSEGSTGLSLIAQAKLVFPCFARVEQSSDAGKGSAQMNVKFTWQLTYRVIRVMGGKNWRKRKKCEGEHKEKGNEEKEN